jgi:hypothetical protein
MSIIAHVIESLYTGVLSHNSLLLRNPLIVLSVILFIIKC